MMDLLSVVFSIAIYVLQALALQTIANRRGVPFAWLGWVPVASLWLLGAIADDYRLKLQGKISRARVILPVLLVALLVLSVALVWVTVDVVLMPLEGVVTYEEIMAAYDSITQTDSVSHMYESVDGNAMKALVAKLEAALTDDVVSEMTACLPVILTLTFGVCAASLAGLLLEYICWYRLFASCEPENKWLYLIISVAFNLQAVFAFLIRQKDLGMIPPDNALPGGAFDEQPPRWEN